jgi:circadian clock protein KaiB
MKNQLNKKSDITREFEEALANGFPREDYVLRLYVTGMTFRSVEAVASIKAFCERHLHGRYNLEIIDIYQHPELAQQEQIVAAPTLIKRLPAPLRRLVGNLSQEERVFIGLDLRRQN